MSAAPSSNQRQTRRSRRGAGSGFTVIELLVAAAITAVLAGFIVAIVSNVSVFWTRTSGRLSAEAQARLVLDQLTLDLSSAVYRDDGNVWMAADVLTNATGGATGLWVAATTPTAAKPSGTTSFDLAATRAELATRGALADARYGIAGTWLRFFTTKRGSNGTAVDSFSAPVAVGYQIIRRANGTATTAKPAYLFHRAEARPATTTPPATPANPRPTARPGVIDFGYNITAAAYTTSTATTNNGATTGDPRSIQVPGSRTNYDSVIAENVIDFGIRCYVRDSSPTSTTGLRLVFPASGPSGAISTATNVRLRAQLPSGTTVDSSNYNFVFPEVVDVMVRILTDEGARLIQNYEAGTLPVPAGVNAQQYWWQLATANSQVFTRRIVLNGKPL